jgi:DNA repair protein RadC
MNQDILSLYKVAEIEITYRNPIPYHERIRINSSHVAYDIFRQCWDDNRIELLEEFKMLLIDNQSRCIGIADIATGGTSACIADPKIIFATALKAKAGGLILAHNHPSGGLIASRADHELNEKIVQGGRLLEIVVLDHLIITPHGYKSLSNEGFMPD